MAKVKDGGLAPGLLIASPPLGDPNFDRTVVLLALHSDAGALGFVVNRIAPVSLGELLDFAGYGDVGAGDRGLVFLGGPVQPSSGWIVCFDESLGSDRTGVIEVGERLRVTSSRTAFDALARDVGERRLADSPRRPDEGGEPGRRIVLLGYSGWGPGQLEGEIASGAWLPVPLDERVLFDVAADDRWERAYALLGITPAETMTMRSIGEA